jgi:hypothetical protein
LSKIDGRAAQSREFNTAVEKVIGYNELFQTAVFYDPIQGVEKVDNADLNLDLSGTNQSIEQVETRINFVPSDEILQSFPQDITPVSYHNNRPQPLPNYQNNAQIDLYNDRTPKNPLESPLHSYYESPVLPHQHMPINYENSPAAYQQPDMRYSNEPYRQVEGQTKMNVIKLNQSQNQDVTPGRGVQHVQAQQQMTPMGQQQQVYQQQQVQYSPQQVMGSQYMQHQQQVPQQMMQTQLYDSQYNNQVASR